MTEPGGNVRSQISVSLLASTGMKADENEAGHSQISVSILASAEVKPDKNEAERSQTGGEHTRCTETGNRTELVRRVK